MVSANRVEGLPSPWNWFKISVLVQKQTNAGMFMHQSMSDTRQFLYQSGTANPQLLGRTCLIIVIDREGTHEKILFYAFKILFHPIAGHEIRNQTRRGYGRLAF